MQRHSFARNRWSAGLLLALVVGAAWSWAAASQGAPGTLPVFAGEDVPWILRSSQSRLLIKEKQQAYVTTDSTSRVVTLHWTSSQYVGQPPNWSLTWDSATDGMGSCKTLTQDQIVTTRFYPTSCAIADADSILVGGINGDGETIIEVWDLTWVGPMPTPVIEGSSGLLVIPISQPNVTKTRVYQADEAGQRFVCSLAGLRVSGSSDAAAILVQFYDSQDVYTVDLGSSIPVLLVSESTPGALFSAPASLAPKDHTGMRFADRTDTGYVYIFERGRNGWWDQPYDAPILILIDGDRNGTIDSLVQLSDLDFEHAGWSDIDNFTEWWLH